MRRREADRPLDAGDDERDDPDGDREAPRRRRARILHPRSAESREKERDRDRERCMPAAPYISARDHAKNDSKTLNEGLKQLLCDTAARL
jgi:hypothetical protein